jgi:dipeptide transport system ATP-binding protein
MSLLEIKNLNVRFGDKTAAPVVDGLDLKVDKAKSWPSSASRARASP